MKKGIYLRDAGTVVIVVLIIGLLSWIHTVNGGDKKGDKGITVTPASEKRK